MINKYIVRVYISLFWGGAGAVLLAASAQNRCTALVCSCYVPSKNLDSKLVEEINYRSSSSKKRPSGVGKNIKDGAMEEVGNNNDELELGQDRIINGGNCSRSSSGTNGPHIELIPTRKSNLKKITTIVDDDQENQLKTEKRKVSWADAHGKDIVHVQEFEPSVSDDGELEGVRNSCVCAIQ